MKAGLKSFNPVRWLAILLVLLLLYTCTRVPITGRKQLNLLPEVTLVQMSLAMYNDFLNENQVVKATPEAKMVEDVGKRISQAVESYMEQQNMKNRILGYQWEFNLVKDDIANAWALPGGKVVVYTGLLPITMTEAGLATVMGHEIAHAVARHGNERMSQALMIQLGGMALDIALMNKPEETKALFMAAYGITATLGVMLPYSRLHETEADKMGMIFMAMAGYNPEEAIHFWERMAKQSPNTVPQFLSTHPAHQTRVENLKAFLPTAMKYYKPR